MSTRIGTASIGVEADPRDFEKSTSRLGGMFKTAGKAVLGVAAGVAAVGVAITGIALKKGLDRALNIEDAQAKLRGLGHDADSVTTIMESALDSVRGTAFGLDAAASLAASAVAAGIAPGQELTGVLKTMADTATIAGAPLSDIGDIFNKIAAGGKVTTRELNQLTQRGVPALQFLADELGVTAAEARKMVESGKVDFAIFEAAMRNNLGGAALESGKTVRGSLANMGAALSRLGAQVLTPLLPVFTKVFGGITEHLDNVGAFLAESVVPQIQRLADVFMEGEGLGESFRLMIAELFGTMEEGSGMLGFIGERFGQIFVGLLKSAAKAIPGIIEKIAEIAPSIIENLIAGRERLIQAAVTLLTGIIEALPRILPQLVDGIVRTVLLIVSTLSAMIPQLISAAVSLFTGLITALVTVMPQIIDGIIQLVKAIVGMIVENVPLLLEGALTLFTTLIDAVVEILPMLLEVLIGEVLPAVLTTVLEMIPELLNTALELFQQLIEAVIKILPDLLRTLLVVVLPQVLTTILGMIPDLLRTAITTFLALVDAVIKVLPELISILLTEVLPAVIGAIIEMAPEILIAAIAAFIELTMALTEVSGMLVEMIFTEVIPGFIDAITTLGPKLYKAGKNIIGELWDGIKEKATQVIDWVKRNVVDKIANLWPFGSPAKEGPMSGKGAPERWGTTMMADLTKGIRQGASDAARAAAAAATQVSNAANITLGTGAVQISFAGAVTGSQAQMAGTQAAEAMLDRLSRARIVQ